MSATLTPSTTSGPAGAPRSPHALGARGRGFYALTGLVVVSAGALAIALAAGATAVFNVVVWLLFTTLWIGFVGALAFRPAALDDAWRSVRRLAVPLQAIVWLLFLPVMCGLFVWHRPWPPFLRVTAVLAIAAWNVFLFFPRF